MSSPQSMSCRLIARPEAVSRARLTMLAGAAGLALALTTTLAPAAAQSQPTVTAAAAPTALVAQPRYVVVDLGVLRGDDLSIPHGINASGDAVGWSGALNQAPVPFIYTDSRGMRRLPMPKGVTSGIARDINDAGDATGHVQLEPALDRAVRWPAAGGVQRLGSLGTPSEASSYGYSINNGGSVVGWSYISPYEFGGQEGFRFLDGTGMFSVTPGARPGFARDLNDTGQITGSIEYSAFRRSGGVNRDISGTLSGNTEGESINARGQVAITQTLPDANNAWRWTPKMGLQSLGLAPTNEPTTAHGINVAGDVVGRGRPAGADTPMGGYLFRDGLGSIALDDLLARGYRHWYISEAWDINDAGQIVAEATSMRTGARHAVRLDPKPTG